MLQKRLVPVGLLVAAVLFGGGCNRDTAAQRDEFTGVITTEDGVALVPVRLPERKGDSILGAVAAGDQPVAQDRETADEPRIDDSSAQAIGDSVVQMAAANDWNPLLDLLIDEQADALEPLIRDLAAFMAAVGQVNRAAGEKAGTHAVVLQLEQEWLEKLATIAAQLTVEVEPDGEDQAVLVFTAGPADAADAPQVEMTARRLEGAWRLVLPNFQAPSDPAALELGPMADDFVDLAGRIRREELTDADSIRAQADRVVGGTYQPSEQGGDQGNADQAAAGGEPAPQPRQRDQVDEVYSGPGMLRGR